MLPISDVVIYGYEPGNNAVHRAEADYAIHGDDIDSIDIGESSEWKDTAKFKVDNYAGKYTNVVDHGDRIQLWLSIPDEADTEQSTARYGESQYGQTRYPGGGLQSDWTGRVRNHSISAEGGANYSLEFEAEDYVYSLLGSHRLWEAYQGRELSGSPDAILNDALTDKVPEIGQSKIRDLGGTTDLKFNGRTLLDLLKEILARGDGVARADGLDLVVTDPVIEAPEFTASAGSGDWLVPTYESNDDDLINDLRVNGGTAPKLDDELAKSGTTTVTENNRIRTRVSTRVSRLDYIEIWTEPSGSEEGLVVRLQQDVNGSPIAPDDNQSDIVNKQLSYHFLADGGWTTFLLPDHTLPEPNPWLIIQSQGTEGQTVGTDGSGNPAYRAHFPYPVSASDEAPQSINEYGRREDRITDENLRTDTAVYDFASANLARRSQPQETVKFVANSYRAHALDVAQLIRVEDDNLGVNNDFVVTGKDSKIASGELKTTLTVKSLNSI